MRVLVAGGDAEALDQPLRSLGAQVTLRAGAETSAGSLAQALGDLEFVLEDERPDVAVACGGGDLALALAISAAKLGVPLAAYAVDAECREGRIVATLADLPAEESDPSEAARTVVSWASNLDSAP